MELVRKRFEESMAKDRFDLSDFSYPSNRYVSDRHQQYYEEFIEEEIDNALNCISQDYNYPHTSQHSTEEYVRNAIQQLIYKGYHK